MLAVGRIVVRTGDVVRRWWLRGHATISTLPLRPASLRLGNTMSPVISPPCDGTLSQTTNEPGLATGNVPMARLTQPHTWLKWPWMRPCYLPWNQPRGARCGAVGESAGIDGQLSGHTPTERRISTRPNRRSGHRTGGEEAAALSNGWKQ
jgi:hypothetical protein